ncbi:MAG: Gfo/Idh/MocA family oxidoreductase [Syntrophales bacterium]|jgi:predicted dehydrogenase|nr:Gfo/Idh/MocA family oxidoreductase [Syntrophales bacterium]MDY0043768.1 Gfo/Idh/MocA family oxidoreductase [Syntrophales bacterium]
MKALVIGYGSIGLRHANILEKLGCHVAVMSRRIIDFNPCFNDIPTALHSFHPEYVVVANRTSEHFDTIKALAEYGFNGYLLVEKPLFETPADLPANDFSLFAVAYNLRFHPVLVRLKKFMSSTSIKPITADIYAGSYLPEWRPGRDYSRSYSAKKNEGGGVLRDLSHELDYVYWLFGQWLRLTAMGGHFSTLDIETEDACSLLMETLHCPLVSIHMNYLDRIPRREIIMNSDRHTVKADLINNTFSINNSPEVFAVNRDDTYCRQHQCILEGRSKELCTAEEALETVYTIKAAEKAIYMNCWVER